MLFRSIAGQHLPVLMPAPSGVMAIAHLALGDQETAGELVGSYRIDSDQLSMIKMLLPELGKCWYLLVQEAYADLLTITTKVVAFGEEQGLSLAMPQFYLIQGQGYLGLGNMAAARKSGQTGLALLDKTGGRWGLSELENLLADIEGRNGN